MKIAVVCANGKAGQLIVKEAVNRGFDVTAVVKGENKSAAQNVIVKDLFDLTAADLAGFDAVVDAFGAWTPETLPQHSTSLAHLCDILSGTDTRLLVVGGAGSLYVNAEHTACVSDGADFPEVFKPLACAMAKALGELRQRNDVKWTYISPAGDFQADGERSGKYILAGEELTLNSKGESIISYADYAIAMVDEIEKGLNREADGIHTVFALASYRNLIKAGRVSRLIGFIAGHLGFWGIGIGSDEGEIAIRGKARGDKSMIRFLVDEMKKVGTNGKEIFISHCQNLKCAQALKEQIEEAFRGVKVTLMETRGLDSFYAERRGLIIGF